MAKTAEFTPMARARVKTAIAVNPGDLISCRNAKRKSWIIAFRCDAAAAQFGFRNVMYRSGVTARWKIIAAYVTLCAVWSSTWLAIKLGLNDLPPVSFAAIRFLIAFVVLVAVSVGRVRLLPKTRVDWLLLASTGVLMFAINYGLLFWGELHISSGLAAVLQATIPVFGMLFAHWLLPAEPLRAKQLVGSLVSI